MDDLIEIYLREKQQAGDFRPATYEGNKTMLQQSCAAMGNPYIGNIGQRDLQAYSTWLKNKVANPGRSGEGLSEATVHTYLNRLRCFFSWAVQTNRISTSPMAQIKIGRVRVTKIHDFCTIEERDKILACPTIPQDVATILHLGFYAGLRFMEMQALRWCDIQDGLLEGGDDRMNILIRAHSWFIPKGKSARIVPAPARLREYLRGIRPGKSHAQSESYIIAPEQQWKADAANGYRYNPKKSFAKIIKLSGMKRSISYHTLRHSYITHHLNAGTSMSLLSQWTGDDETTIRNHYAGYSPDASRVEAIGS